MDAVILAFLISLHFSLVYFKIRHKSCVPTVGARCCKHLAASHLKFLVSQRTFILGVQRFHLLQKNIAMNERVETLNYIFQFFRPLNKFFFDPVLHMIFFFQNLFRSMSDTNRTINLQLDMDINLCINEAWYLLVYKQNFSSP